MASNKEAPMSTPIDPGPPFLLLFAETYIVTKGAPAVVFFFLLLLLLPYFYDSLHVINAVDTMDSTRIVSNNPNWSRARAGRNTSVSRSRLSTHTHTHSKWNLFLPWRHVNLSRLLAASWEIKVERGCSSILIGGKLCISLHSCHALIVCYGTLGASIPTAASRFLFSFFVRNFVVVALLALSSDQFTIIAAGRMYKFTGPEFPSPWNPRYIYISQEKCNQSIISFLAVICWARPHSTATRLWAATWRKKKKIFFFIF